MKLVFTASFQRDCGTLPSPVRRAFDKSLAFLSVNLRHPSLRAKKLPGTEVRYARITRGWRFTFQFEGDVVLLRRAGTHDILAAERRRGS